MFINVEDYGAVGDGQTKDAIAIQAALDEAIPGQAGVTVWIPEGTYILERTLYVSSNTHIIAAANARLVRDHSGYLATNGRPSDSFEGYGGNSNIQFEGGIWDFNGTKQTVMHNCFAIGHGENITFEKMEVRDVAGAHAIEVCGCRNVQIKSCQFLGFIDSGGRNFSEAVQIDLMKGAWAFGAFGSYDHTPCENIWIMDCYFGSSSTIGSQVWPRGIGSHSSTIGRWHRNIIIANNIFEGLTMQAVRAFNWQDVSIHHNQIKHCGAGINVVSAPVSDPKDTKDVSGSQTGRSQPCHNFDISNNIISGGLAYNHGININGEKTGVLSNVSISNNIISDSVCTSAFSGIYIRNGDAVQVNNNILRNIRGTAIAASAGQHYTITSNVILDTGGDGVKVTDSVYFIDIVSNMVREAAYSGIVVSDHLEMVSIIGNTIAEVNRDNKKDIYHMAVTKNVNGVNISANTCSNEKKDNKAAAVLKVSASCKNVTRNGNNFQGLVSYDATDS
ncbi:right-handed parallel beta-helix repeat-containing protein [Sediminibacillus albus]|uniref:Right handed beta helix region n=1 Tax=Sediminibacillus albus TaxID=407036 RepID=A0A1G8X5B9_9BACI|nr:right-handed parallel beta-helix repeat-containing protein [Sediminibacillus albus]SDJ85819.1 Right handed beta helix region [Sediminibacillus albus]